MKNKELKKWFLYVRKYCIFSNKYELYINLVETTDIYHSIGKYFASCIEEIKRIDFCEYSVNREKYWLENGYEIYENKQCSYYD